MTAAGRWLKSRTATLQSRHPELLWRGSAITLDKELNLERILAGYEAKRKAGNPEFMFPGEPSHTAKAEPIFTPRQGQFLAFIHAYTKIHGQPPAEAEMERYFKVTPPTIHDMILLDERLIRFLRR